MANILRGKRDADVRALRAALADYEVAHPGSIASLFRANPGVIRVRIIDDRWAGVNRARRHAQAWKFLRDRVGEDLMGQVYALLTLSTAELRSSLANMEFDDPLPAAG